MTFKYNNVYLNNCATVAGKIESEGPLGTNFDKIYKDFYLGTKTWEQAEIKMVTECTDILLNKINKKKAILEKYDPDSKGSVVKCGILVKEPTREIEPNKYGVIKGQNVEDPVLINFYIKHSEPLEIGSKIA
jgi:hypothetical protein